MSISFTNDQSEMVRMQLKNLENSMIMGIILVVLVLFFFLGTRNAMFVGLAIPMSMFLSFVILSLGGFKINMIVLFALILALGMLVDNAIVVVENIYRFIDKGYKPLEAARQAVGEIAVPIIVSTATTLAAFVPLAFWKGMIGEFMKNLPITLIIVLTSSLFVALVIIPVFSATFINSKKKNNRKTRKKKAYRNLAIMAGIAIVLYVGKIFFLANLLSIFVLIFLFNILFLDKIQRWFRIIFLVKLESAYLRVLNFALKGRNPVKLFIGTILLLFFTLILFQVRKPDINFFPQSDPNYINIIAELPVGTDIMVTDSVMKIVEKDIDEILIEERKIVESVLTTIGTGSSDGFQTGDEPNKGLITITFIDYQYRMGINTSEVLKKISDQLIGYYPGVQISFEKSDMGPPTGKAINIEVAGRNYDQLLYLTDSLQAFIEQSDIEGIEGLKIDLEVDKPQLLIQIDREKARRLGVSTIQIAGTIRTALFGKEISDFKVGEDEYPIQLRLQDKYRYSVAALMNQKISFWDDGKMIQIPISAVADIKYSTTYGAVNRKNMDRVITLYSNVVEGHNATKINNQ
ncbi:MAG: efflux RND transporter permease subunit, partial [Bacteroidales bacterium]|nr:efflux RND transporter permease subunit [Bacteroidales bacterium]